MSNLDVTCVFVGVVTAATGRRVIESTFPAKGDRAKSQGNAQGWDAHCDEQVWFLESSVI